MSDLKCEKPAVKSLKLQSVKRCAAFKPWETWTFSKTNLSAASHSSIIWLHMNWIGDIFCHNLEGNRNVYVKLMMPCKMWQFWKWWIPQWSRYSWSLQGIKSQDFWLFIRCEIITTIVQSGSIESWAMLVRNHSSAPVSLPWVSDYKNVRSLKASL